MNHPRFEGEFSWAYADKGPWWKFRSQEILILSPFTYYWQGHTPITIPKGFVSDGYSIPFFVQVLTLNQLTNYMHGLQASVVHDYVCQEILLTRRERVDLFKEATDVLNVNKYNRWLLTLGVSMGSYLGFCGD